jgi:hypothetical protein
MADVAGGEAEPVLFEGAHRLSESVLWRVHDAYFEESGVTAWASGDVPHAVTTGPVLARSYARLVEGLVDDCHAGRFGGSDPAAPIYVVELGAGSGRLGFQVLSALDAARLEPYRAVYVMTDRAKANVEFWLGNPRLEQFVAAGRLDFAQFDPTTDRTVHLERAGTELVSGGIANPMVVVTNYLFDVLPQDLFAVVDGELYEELVEVYLDDATVTERAADFFDHVRLAAHRQPITEGRYASHLGSLLEGAARRAGDGQRFLFPVGGLAALDNVLDLATGRVLWLIGERPPRRLQPVGVEAAPTFKPGPVIRMGIHGRSISLPVDLPVLAAAAGTRGAGAELLLPRDPPPAFLAAAIVAGDAGAASSSRAAYGLAIDDLAPELVAHVVKRALRDRGEGASLQDLVAILRTARYDPRTFERCLPGLTKHLPSGGAELVDEAVAVFRRILELDYPLVAATDLAGSIGALLATSGREPDAVWFFERSLPGNAPDAGKLVTMARCYARLGSLDRAAELAEQALALDATCAEAEAVLGELRGTAVTTGR